jgi:excinuclease UvrABC nuclease subunit
MLTFNDLDKLPKASGIYRVMDCDRNVIYVGQSKNIYERWNSGKHEKHDEAIKYCNGSVPLIDWVLMPEWLLNRAENCAVRFYDPVLNQITPAIV